MMLRLVLFAILVTLTFKTAFAQTFAQEEYYEDYENEITPENRVYDDSKFISVGSEDRAGTQSPGIFGFFAAPANQAFFLIRMFFQASFLLCVTQKLS